MDADRLPRPIADALRAVRITEAMQYCFMPSGDWQTDASPAPYKPADAVGFHIMVGGRCWLEIGGARHMLEQGDIAAFPRGTGHRLGVGTDGALFDPGAALPPPPWQATPMLRFGDGGRQVRLLCGYVTCEAMNFPLFRQMMPDFIHLRTGGGEDWLAGTLRQIVQEVDRPEAGGVAVLERLTEVALLEVLRRQFARQRAEAPGTGWLAAAHDPVVGRALAMLHERPAEGACESGCALRAAELVAHAGKRLVDEIALASDGRWPVVLAGEPWIGTLVRVRDEWSVHVHGPQALGLR